MTTLQAAPNLEPMDKTQQAAGENPLASGAVPVYALDPVTFMINECMVISSAMRKATRWSQGGVAAILGATDFFADDENLLSNMGLSASSPRNGAQPVPSNPLHSSFLQLRAILSETADIAEIDSLTLLQPFLLTIESSATSGAVTSLALNAISKMLHYHIISFRSKNLANTLVQLTSSLTHCRFEASDQNSDDAVLLKVLSLLNTILVGPLSCLLPNAVVSEVIHTCMSLACNKRRSEVLRRAAEMAMVSMTIRIFSRVRELEPEPESFASESLPANYPALHADVIGNSAAKGIDSTFSTPSTDTLNDPSQPTHSRSATVDLAPTSPRKLQSKDSPEPQFDMQCILEFFGLLISLSSPSNQYQHMESTRVFALSLINTAIEVAGDKFPDHPSLMALVADPVSKDVLQIISSTDSPALLQVSLRLFCTMAVIMNAHLKSQMELTFDLLFKSILPPKSKTDNQIKGNTTAVSYRAPASKEMIVESLSFLWTRSPHFFAQLFVEFDCDFEKSDLATNLINFLCELALPESALATTDNVPPLCLEGLLAFVSGVNERSRKSAKDIDSPNTSKLIADKVQKTSFIRCMEIFNSNPKKGVAALHEANFIKDPNNAKELADFFFKKSTRLNKKVLGEFLAKPANVDLLKEFMSLFDFGGLRVDEGLRMMLKSFRLPGESQQIERIVELFAESYVSSQTEENTYVPEDQEDKEPVLPDRDAVFILSYSIIMLNTDLHNPQVKKSMDLEAYRKNLKGVYNGKDFPEWYMAGIYNSIRDREIIMPEEHHGTDKWFDDVWHNLISTQSKYARDHGNSIKDFHVSSFCHFDKLFFQSVVDNVVNTLIKVFKEASDDNIITKLMSSVDKCANICINYGLDESIDRLIETLSGLTTLSDTSLLTITEDENFRNEIPITQITLENKDEPITVSELSVHFGRDFKAQLSTVVLFRLIKKPMCQVSDSWEKILKIFLSLFENCLIDPNLFTEFQRKLKLSPLPKVKPNYIISKVKPLKESGLLSTFSSFLKGYSDEPEPTDSEIESTLSSIDCVKSVNVPVIFDIVSKSDKAGMSKFTCVLLKTLPTYAEDKKRFYETEVTFLFEIIVCFSLIVNETEVTGDVIKELSEYIKSQHITKRGYIRLTTYYYLLTRIGADSHVEGVLSTIEHLSSFDKEILASHGSSLIQPLISLVDDECKMKELMYKPSYWAILKSLASVEEFGEEILEFNESIVRNSAEEVNQDNFVPFLGVLDEISSLGAIGASWEQNQTEKAATAELEKEKEAANSLVRLSKRSITLTGELSVKQSSSSYPLLQALAHQCFNPCREIRAHASQVLQSTVLSSHLNQEFTAEGIFEFGLFPLLSELQKEDTISTDPAGFSDTHVQILSLVGKTFLQYHQEMKSEDREKIWLGLVHNFATVNSSSPAAREPSLEVMKNMLLVLQNDFLTPENAELWEKTWAQLEDLFPGLKDEVSSH